MKFGLFLEKCKIPEFFPEYACKIPPCKIKAAII